MMVGECAQGSEGKAAWFVTPRDWANAPDPNGVSNCKPLAKNSAHAGFNQMCFVDGHAGKLPINGMFESLMTWDPAKPDEGTPPKWWWWNLDLM
jgi:prepilin-type processing-associated H-X9-DG protein